MGDGMGGSNGERLLDVDDAVLCVIDVQPGFVDELERSVRAPFVQRVVWIVGVARAMGVPVVVTEEEPDRNGPSLPEVLAQVPDDAARFTKPTFGLADVPEILAVVEATGRRTAVLVGAETDVCVSHSALGLLDRGFRVVVARDAVASPGSAHDDGLARMRDAGVVVIGAKGLYYEWVRTVDRLGALRDAIVRVPTPDGLVL
jgi:nicotinamidase-related amidase